jgi:hypothetical protein
VCANLAKNVKIKLSVLSSAVGFLALFSIFPFPVRGQGNTWAGASLAQVMESAPWRVGAFRVNASLALANLGYDTDIYYGYLDEAFPDFTFSAATPVQIFLPLGKKVVLEAFESPQYLFYLNNEKESAWNNVFRGQVHFALDRIYVQAGGGLSNVRQRLSPELNVNVREKKDDLHGALLWQLSGDVSMALLAEDASFDYGENESAGVYLSETLNRRESYLDAVAYLQPNPRIRLFLNGQYGTYAFKSEISSMRDSRSYGVFGGLAFVPRENEARRIDPPQGSLTVGFKIFDMINPLAIDGSDFVGTMNLSTGIFKRTMARIFLSRDFTFSAYAGSTYYLSTTYGGGLIRRLSMHATLSYDLSFSRSVYPENVLGPSIEHNYHYTIHNLSLNVRLARSLEVMFFGMFGRRSQDAPELTRTRGFVGLNLVYGIATSSVAAPTRGLSL